MLLAVAGLLFLAGIGVTLFQCYLWIRQGEWMPISLLNGLEMLKVQEAWVFYPTDLIGLHKALDFAPLSMSFLFLSMILAWVSTVFDA